MKTVIEPHRTGAEAVVELFRQGSSVRGWRSVYRHASLAQFVATFEPF